MRLIKHINNTDVAVEVLKSFYVKEKRLMKIKVQWWNIGRHHAPWPMNITQRLSIPVDDWVANWKPYKYEENDEGVGDKMP